MVVCLHSDQASHPDCSTTQHTQPCSFPSPYRPIPPGSLFPCKPPPLRPPETKSCPSRHGARRTVKSCFYSSLSVLESQALAFSPSHSTVDSSAVSIDSFIQAFLLSTMHCPMRASHLPPITSYSLAMVAGTLNKGREVYRQCRVPWLQKRSCEGRMFRPYGRGKAKTECGRCCSLGKCRAQ
jgi:hypothetical protein